MRHNPCTVGTEHITRICEFTTLFESKFKLTEKKDSHNSHRVLCCIVDAIAFNRIFAVNITFILCRLIHTYVLLPFNFILTFKTTVSPMAQIKILHYLFSSQDLNVLPSLKFIIHFNKTIIIFFQNHSLKQFYYKQYVTEINIIM